MARFRNNQQQSVVEQVYDRDGLKVERVQSFYHTALLPETAYWRAWSFCITLGGTRYVQYQDRTYTLAPNTIFWTSPLKEVIRTRCLPGTGSDMVVLTFSAPRWNQFVEQHPTFSRSNTELLAEFPKQPLLALHLAPPQLLYVLRRLIGLSQSGNAAAIENQCTLLLHLIGDLRFGAALRGQEIERRRVEAAQSQIVEHLARPFSLQQLATALNISPRQLQRDFVACTGLTPMRYLNMVRLSEANFLLAETSLPIAQIAAMLGYVSLTHFSAAFRQIYHCSPRQVREQHGDRHL